MTADRRLYLIPVLTAAIALSLLTSACGSSPGTSSTAAGGNTATSSAESTESTSQGSTDTSRETAETRLEAIGTQLSTVAADYNSGKKQQAYTLAKSISDNLYEGTTEGIVSKIDPTDDRQVDSLLAAALPAAIQNGESPSQVAALVQRARQLAADCLAAIRKTE